MQEKEWPQSAVSCWGSLLWHIWEPPSISIPFSSEHTDQWQRFFCEDGSRAGQLSETADRGLLSDHNGKGSAIDVVKADEIALTYQGNGASEELLKKQNIFLWPAAFFEKEISRAEPG